METLTISIPDANSSIVKEILKKFGVTILNKKVSKSKPSDFAGIISPENAKKLLTEIEQDRQKWERNI